MKRSTALPHRRLVFVFLGLSLVLFLCDVCSKLLVTEHLEFGQVVSLTPFLALVRVHNEGAAFGILSDAGPAAGWFLIVVGVAVCSWIVWRLCSPRPGERLFESGLAVLLGGALGNLLDRILYGFVVDFVDLHYRDWHWPAFNLADTAITVGVILLLLDITGLGRKFAVGRSKG